MLKEINNQLREKIKDLNDLVEKAIDKAQTKKKIGHPVEVDIAHKIKVREKEVANSEKQIQINEHEIKHLTAKLNELANAESAKELESRLVQAKEKKKKLEKELRLQQMKN
jgi:predicted RNase H-like nuclease (RuvC/YqgF family)